MEDKARVHYDMTVIVHQRTHKSMATCHFCVTCANGDLAKAIELCSDRPIKPTHFWQNFWHLLFGRW